MLDFKLPGSVIEKNNSKVRTHFRADLQDREGRGFNRTNLQNSL